MIDDLKPYPAYKDSGVPWLGAVPSEWPLVAVRRAFRAVTRRDIRGDEIKMSMSRHLGLVPSSALGARSSVQSERLSYSVCHPGDLVMNKYQAHAGLFGCARVRGLITPNYSVFRAAPGVDANYYARLFASAPYQNAFEMASYGVGDGMAPLYTGVFYRILTVLPPPDEQAAIVRFLDYADRRIRRYIRAKQKLIKLLEEQKQVIIHRAVTRGLDPNVRLKPSGIDWLGDIPEHWQVQRLKTVFREIDRRSGTGAEPLLSLRMQAGLVDHHEAGGKPIPAANLAHYKRTEPGEIVMNRMRAAMGLFGVTPKIGLVSPDYAVFRPRFAVELRYFGYLFRTPMMMSVFRLASRGLGTGQSGFLRLYGEQFGTIHAPVPSLDEQMSIVRHLTNATDSLQHASNAAAAEIALLREYRTRLIADVVTGKLDVRAAAAALPDEPDEPDDLEPADDTDEDPAEELAEGADVEADE